MNNIVIQKGAKMPNSAGGIFSAFPHIQEIRTEIVRKSIHFLIALTPSLAALNLPFTIAILNIGVLFYTIMENMRLAGIEVPLVSSLTTMASRPRDKGRFVLGPVTLGLGALLSLLLYPSPVASIAIYALAFGDGFASLVGKFFGHLRPAIMMGKSIEGSSACFLSVFIATLALSNQFKTTFIAALTATLVEAMPLEDYDNLALPMAVGFILQIHFFLGA
jgi:dolichol kinase